MTMMQLLSHQGQMMNTPILTIEERHNIDSGAWFSSLSPALRAAILARATVRRLTDGAPLAARGTPAEDWVGVAKGAVRVSSVSLSGKQYPPRVVGPLDGTNCSPSQQMTSEDTSSCPCKKCQLIHCLPRNASRIMVSAASRLSLPGVA